MNCSHGLPFEVKCRGCFEDAMKLFPVPVKPVEQKPIDHKPNHFTNVSYNKVVDSPIKD